MDMLTLDFGSPQDSDEHQAGRDLMADAIPIDSAVCETAN
jgi:hypothetical protein